MKPPLNLASRPLRNETLPRTLFGLASVGLTALTIQHAIVVSSMPARTASLHSQAAILEESRVRTEAAALRGPKPDPSLVKQWALIKELVDRRTLSWSALLFCLEEVLPDGIRLVSISPKLVDGRGNLALTAVARSTEVGLGFVRTLEERAEFEEVYPVRVATHPEGEEFHYSVRYVPSPALAGMAQTASASPGEAPALAGRGEEGLGRRP